MTSTPVTISIMYVAVNKASFSDWLAKSVFLRNRL